MDYWGANIPDLAETHHPWALGLRSLPALRLAYVGAYVQLAWQQYQNAQPEPIDAGSAAGLVDNVILQPLQYQGEQLVVPALQFDYGYEFDIPPNAVVRACRDNSHSHNPVPTPPCLLAGPLQLIPAYRPIPADSEPTATQGIANLLHSGRVACPRTKLEQIATELEETVQIVLGISTPLGPTVVAAVAEQARQLRHLLEQTAT
jgi:hypothetical protein